MLNFFPSHVLPFSGMVAGLPYLALIWLTDLVYTNLLLVLNSGLLCPSHLDVTLLPHVEYQKGSISESSDWLDLYIFQELTVVKDKARSLLKLACYVFFLKFENFEDLLPFMYKSPNHFEVCVCVCRVKQDFSLPITSFL